MILSFGMMFKGIAIKGFSAYPFSMHAVSTILGIGYVQACT